MQNKVEQVYKAILVILLIFSATTLVCKAESKYLFIAQAGGNVTTFAGGPDEFNFNSKLGFHVGGFAGHNITEKYGLDLGAFVSSKGAIFTLPVATDQVEGRAEFNNNIWYLDFPIYARFMPVPELSFFAGPQVSMLLNNTVSVSMFGFSLSDSEDASEYSYSIDFAVSTGVRYTHEIGLFISSSYSWGLTNIYDVDALEELFKDEFDDEFDDDLFDMEDFENFKNRVLKVSLGFSF